MTPNRLTSIHIYVEILLTFDFGFHYRHEIVGVVTDAGASVTSFKAGDLVGVGTYVNSCRECEYCHAHAEHHCDKGAIRTFNSIDIDGTFTKGGYSNYIVVHQR